MDKSSALALYLVVVIIVFIVARIYQINLWSAIVLALVVGLIVLFFLTPQSSLDSLKKNCNWEQWLYLGIWALTILIVLFYVLDRAFRDRPRQAIPCLAFTVC